MGRGSFYRAHCLCAHLPSPFVDSFKVSLKCIQGFRRSIRLNLLIEVRRAEAARKLENLESEKKNCPWVWDKPCYKETQVWQEAGHVFFWQFAVTFVDGVSEPLPLSHRVSPLDDSCAGLWGHSSLQRGNFLVSHGKCSPLRSPHLGERLWYRNTRGEPQWYF